MKPPHPVLITKNKFFGPVLFVFFAALTFLLYYSSINNFYVLDDFIFLKAVSEGWLTDTLHFFPVPLKIYRILYDVFGLTPAPVRVFNYIVNAAVCLTVYKFSYKFLELFDKSASEKVRFLIALFSSLIFAVHYIHVETIVYFSMMHELLYSFFYLLGLFYYLKYRQDNRKANQVIVFISFAFCMFSKETAVSFILIVFVSEIFLFKSRFFEFIRNYYFLFLIVLLFLFLRLLFFRELRNLSYAFEFTATILEIFKNIIFAFTSFAVSLDFMYIKDIYKGNGTNLSAAFSELLRVYPAAIAGIIAAASFYVLALLKNRKTAYICTAYVLVTISSFAWIAGYERYLYLPSVGFCILVSQFAFGSVKNLPKLMPVVIAALLMFIAYNIYNLEQKKNNWDIAAGISNDAISKIVTQTRELPPGSKVYLKDLPEDYKGAWILRNGIYSVPEIFIKRKDMEFYYYYELEEKENSTKNVYIYNYPNNSLNQR
jgi:hypothetical protein